MVLWTARTSQGVPTPYDTMFRNLKRRSQTDMRTFRCVEQGSLAVALREHAPVGPRKQGVDSSPAGIDPLARLVEHRRPRYLLIKHRIQRVGCSGKRQQPILAIEYLRLREKDKARRWIMSARIG